MDERRTARTRELTEAETAGGLSPDEAFAVLGNEVRVDVLRVLWEAGGGPVTFGDLRERVGVADSGRFDYHLDKLRDHFVRRTDDGYVLRYAGEHVMAAVLSGAYDHAGFAEPVPVGDPCPECGGDLQMTYGDERATIDCPDCGEHVTSSTLPAGVFEDRDPETLPRTFDRWMAAQIRKVDAGFCMACDGRTEPELLPDGMAVEVPGLELDADGPHVLYECRRCGNRVLSTVGEAVRDHPAVVSFYHERGTDVLSEPSWRLDWLDADAATVVSRDPTRVRLRVGEDVDDRGSGSEADPDDTDGEHLVVTVEDDLTVSSVERV